MYQFKMYFQMLKDETTLVNKKGTKYYTWQDSQWSSFMIHFIKNLEPRRFQQGEIIYRDLEETEEIYFVTSGDVSILIGKSF